MCPKPRPGYTCNFSFLFGGGFLRRTVQDWYKSSYVTRIWRTSLLRTSPTYNYVGCMFYRRFPRPQKSQKNKMVFCLGLLVRQSSGCVPRQDVLLSRQQLRTTRPTCMYELVVPVRVALGLKPRNSYRCNFERHSGGTCFYHAFTS